MLMHAHMDHDTDKSFVESIGAGLLTVALLSGIGFLLYMALFNVT